MTFDLTCVLHTLGIVCQEVLDDLWPPGSMDRVPFLFPTLKDIAVIQLVDID